MDINIEVYEKLHNYMLNQKLREWYLSLAADSVWKLKELVHLDMRQKTNSFNLKLYAAFSNYQLSRHGYKPLIQPVQVLYLP